MRNLDNYNFKHKRAIIRVDFNVPLNSDLSIADDNKIRAALPTISRVIEDGGVATLMSHLGRPKNGYEEKFSLRPVAEYLSKLLKQKVKLVQHTDVPPENPDPGSVFLLENLRFDSGETSCDVQFAERLAKWGDVYINDAFGTAHRAHTSTTLLPTYCKDKMAGLLMQKELENADKLLKKPKRPFIAVIGGLKIGDKLGAIEGLMDSGVSMILLGGGVANTFHKANGYKTGKSFVEDSEIDAALRLMEKAAQKHKQIILPTDFVVVKEISEKGAADRFEVLAGNMEDDWIIADIGPSTISLFKYLIFDGETILWSGPMGAFEIPFLDKGTIGVLEGIKDARLFSFSIDGNTETGFFSLVGGGDTVAAVKHFGYENSVSYLSTGGSALLKYFAGESFPALKALE